MNLSRRSFFKKSGAAVAVGLASNVDLASIPAVGALEVLPEVSLPEVSLPPVPVPTTIHDFNWQQISWVVGQDLPTKNWDGSILTVDMVKDFAASKGLDYSTFISRFSTIEAFHDLEYVDMADDIDHPARSLDSVVGEEWNKLTRLAERMGYNPDYSRVQIYHSMDHQAVPRDIELYKELRKRSMEQSYLEHYDDSLPEDIQKLVDSDIFYGNEQVLLRTLRGETSVYNEITGEVEELAMVLSSSIPQPKFKVVEIFGDNFSFVLCRDVLVFE